MSKLENFLSNLEDFELASFYHFRFNSFLKYSKKIILNELKRRNIEELEVNKYLPVTNEKIEEDIIAEKICPKCYSNKFYSSNETESILIKFETYDYSEKYKTCLICLYSQEKINHDKKRKTLWNNLSAILFLKNKKIIKS
ncbi:hypothetical protein [Flavicella sediminum]|uniref:hypothetical protein n=1 Tax=Flavicella sediminum TaxID=2585141 RepID=UPI0011238215|nr:hypothetical protein [Flavicella sediminum]